jgi:hypothetical protein
LRTPYANAISLGGDVDTLACIAGGVAEAYYGGTPQELPRPVIAMLDKRLVAVVDRFRKRFACYNRFPKKGAVCAERAERRACGTAAALAKS